VNAKKRRKRKPTKATNSLKILDEESNLLDINFKKT